MQRNQTITALAAGLSMAFSCAGAHADDLLNTVKIGYAAINFHEKSGDLTGQGPAAAFTPPGVQLDLRNTSFVTLGYERRLSDQWSIQLHAGVPPTIKMEGAGNAPPGTNASATAWAPAVLAAYSLTHASGIRPYVGAGVSYTFFTKEEVKPIASTALGGPTKATLDSSWAPVVRLGLEYPIAKDWVIDFTYTRFLAENEGHLDHGDDRRFRHHCRFGQDLENGGQSRQCGLGHRIPVLTTLCRAAVQTRPHRELAGLAMMHGAAVRGPETLGFVPWF